MITFTIDLKGIKTSEDLIRRFYDTLELPKEYFNDSWDGLTDWMENLGSDSEIVSKMNPVPNHVHLIIKNYREAKVLDFDYKHQHGISNDFKIFNEILIRWTDNSPEIRGVGQIVNIKITFEVHHGDY